MTTLNVQISAGNDDADDTGSVDSGGNNINMDASTSGNDEQGGFVWDSVTVPNGATINSATWEPYVRLAGNDPGADIYGEDVDDADDFVTTADINGRTKTSASVEWDAENVVASDGFVESPDIASIISEITSRGGWSSGNSLCLVVIGKTSLNRGFLARSYDNDAAQGAKLNIDYTAAASGGLWAGSLGLMGVGI
ncbi:MAG: hypothetical protein DWQ20_00960 [Actinobacteria bacterium]|nr:MAG: hypothetical protein DWQ20_00960 [Actinomycetota bacterium]